MLANAGQYACMMEIQTHKNPDAAYAEHEQSRLVTRPVPHFTHALYESAYQWIRQHHRGESSFDPTCQMLDAAGSEAEYWQLIDTSILKQITAKATSYLASSAAWQTTRYYPGSAGQRLNGFEPYLIGHESNASDIHTSLVEYFQELITIARNKRFSSSGTDTYWKFRHILFSPHSHHTPTEIVAAAMYFGSILGAMTQDLRSVMSRDGVVHRANVYRTLSTATPEYQILFSPHDYASSVEHHTVAILPRKKELETVSGLDEADIDNPAVILHMLGQVGDPIVRSLLETIHHPMSIHLPENETDVHSLAKRVSSLTSQAA